MAFSQSIAPYTFNRVFITALTAANLLDGDNQFPSSHRVHAKGVDPEFLRFFVTHERVKISTANNRNLGTQTTDFLLSLFTG